MAVTIVLSLRHQWGDSDINNWHNSLRLIYQGTDEMDEVRFFYSVLLSNVHHLLYNVLQSPQHVFKDVGYRF